MLPLVEHIETCKKIDAITLKKLSKTATKLTAANDGFETLVIASALQKKGAEVSQIRSYFGAFLYWTTMTKARISLLEARGLAVKFFLEVILLGSLAYRNLVDGFVVEYSKNATLESICNSKKTYVQLNKIANFAIGLLEKSCSMEESPKVTESLSKVLEALDEKFALSKPAPTTSIDKFTCLCCYLIVDETLPKSKRPIEKNPYFDTLGEIARGLTTFFIRKEVNEPSLAQYYPKALELYPFMKDSNIP